MNQFLLVVAVAFTVGLIVFGITVLVTGDDAGLAPAEPDGRAIPLPADRPLTEADLTEIKFDMALRGYRMAQVDVALRRSAYDIGYKDELIRVLQAEVDALREGRLPEAEVLRRAREAALAPLQAVPPPDQTAPASASASTSSDAEVEVDADADADPADAEEPADELAEESADEPVEEPVDELAEESADEPVEEPVDEPAEEPADEAATADAGDRRG